MGIDSLRDLALAGVKWELDDTPKIADYEIKNTAGKNDSPAQPLTIPASAPMNPKEAETAVNGIDDINALCNAIKDFNHPLKMFAKNTVLPISSGRLLVITDVPSGDDDESGKILSGGAGDMFNKMIGAIGLSYENITICPLVFWRAPGGRTPTDEELEIARPFVRKLIELVQPRAILTLGTLAKDELRRTKDETTLTSYFLLPTSYFFSIPHPNYLMLKPDSKKAAWEELQKLQKILQNEENKV